MSDQMLHGALNAPYRLEDIDVVQFSNLVSAASRASISIAELEAQLVTARADGYAAGVRDAADKCAYGYENYQVMNSEGTHYAPRAQQRAAKLMAGIILQDIHSLIPPDSEKGGAE